MNQIIGKSVGAPYPAPVRYYGELRVMGRPVLCTLPDPSPARVIHEARELMELVS